MVSGDAVYHCYRSFLRHLLRAHYAEVQLAMNRAEHLAWAKQRALDELGRGDTTNAIASMLSDLDKHPGTKMSVLMAAMIAPWATGSGDEVRKWIEGFK